MVCPRCGAEIKENQNFCPKCGYPLKAQAGSSAQPAEPAENPAQPQEQNVQSQPQGSPQQQTQPQGYGQYPQNGQQYPQNPQQYAKPKKSKTGLIIGLICAVVVIAAVCVYVFVFGATLDINKYVTVTIDGPTGYATATVDADIDSLADRWGKKIYNSIDSIYLDSSDLGIDLTTATDEEKYRAAAEFLVTLVEYEGYFDKEDNISNGDTVTYYLSDTGLEYLLEEMMPKLKYKVDDITVEVSGLEEAPTFDAFEGISITYDGAYPYAYAAVEDNSPGYYTDYLYYTIDNYSYVSEGDTITVTIDGTYSGESVASVCLDQFGAVPAEMSKTFTLTGVPYYATSLSDIPQTATDELISIYNDYAATADNGEGVSQASIEYVGSYLLHCKEGMESEYRYNYYYLIFKVTDHVEYQTLNADISYYYLMTYTNLVVNGDGTVTVDDYYITYDDPSSSMEVTAEDGQIYTFTYYGYESVDQIYQNMIEPDLDEYDMETTITQ
ncbi:MAG: zinc-ribbon domain-containing protein [Oscillospiraceae bacterium]|jgi:hypothetical protein